ncbi:hypothetical protein AVEN_35278-1 [Araneus ventricosus]|uniref:Uncharacterized protein n=1 Tax=Araneus ventricosus TaxID=182803 RepID=A0A4Y2EEP7_ARAVE|nr:hypothetical protein AVEN_35278-1 [Araneus ventricosus]
MRSRRYSDNGSRISEPEDCEFEIQFHQIPSCAWPDTLNIPERKHSLPAGVVAIRKYLIKCTSKDSNDGLPGRDGTLLIINVLDQKKVLDLPECL